MNTIFAKVLSFLFLLLLCVSLCACGAKNATVAQNGETKETQKAAEGRNAAGTQTYENDKIGIGCTVDASWTVYDEKQRAERDAQTDSPHRRGQHNCRTQPK